MRQYKLTLPVHTFHFNPLQMQTTALLRLNMDALGGALSTQLADARILIHEYKWSLVVVGIQIDFMRPLNFFDASWMDLTSSLKLVGGNRLVELNYQISTNDNPAIAVKSLWHSINLSGGAAMDGLPGPVPDPVLRMFQPDEIDTNKPARELPALIEALKSNGKKITDSVYPFTLSRDGCEVADQWQNVEIASLAGKAREKIGFTATDDRASWGLGKPLTSLRAQLGAPMYFGDDGEVHTTVYWHNQQVVYLHNIFGKSRGDQRPLCATVAETIS